MDRKKRLDLVNMLSKFKKKKIEEKYFALCKKAKTKEMTKD